MKVKIFLLLFIVITCFFVSCNQRDSIEKRPVFNIQNLKVGDSIFTNKLLNKIIFSDSSLIVDSIVYLRYGNSLKTIKSSNSFIKGKKAFENIEYYENGKIKSYQFLDDECENCFQSIKLLIL